MLTVLRLLQWAAGAVLVAALAIRVANFWLSRSDVWRAGIDPAYRDTYYTVIFVPGGTAAALVALAVFCGAGALRRVLRARGR